MCRVDWLGRIGWNSTPIIGSFQLGQWLTIASDSYGQVFKNDDNINGAYWEKWGQQNLEYFVECKSWYNWVLHFKFNQIKPAKLFSIIYGWYDMADRYFRKPIFQPDFIDSLMRMKESLNTEFTFATRKILRCTISIYHVQNWRFLEVVKSVDINFDAVFLGSDSIITL